MAKFRLILTKYVFFLFLRGPKGDHETSAFSDAADGQRVVVVTFNQSVNSTDINEIAESLESCFLYNKDNFPSRDISVVMLSSTKLDKLTRICSLKEALRLTAEKVKEDWFNGMIIPGTKWCGAGDIANSYEDLGLFAATDRCCRDHDHCDRSLEPGASLDYAVNNSSFYMLHCKCDSEFNSCLKTVNDIPSNMIGSGYFDLLARPCLAYHYRQDCCIWERKSGHLCLRYRLTGSRQFWQHWDPMPYVKDEGKKAEGENACEF